MKRLQRPRTGKRPPRRPQTEDLDAASSDRVLQMLVGANDFYWHHRIQRIFAGAGIDTRRIEREEAQPIWRVCLTRRSCDLAPDNQTAGEQLLTLLRTGGIEVQCTEFNIVDRRGDQLSCVFNLDLGAPGIVQRRPPFVGQGELWAESH